MNKKILHQNQKHVLGIQIVYSVHCTKEITELFLKGKSNVRIQKIYKIKQKQTVTEILMRNTFTFSDSSRLKKNTVAKTLKKTY